MPVLCKPTPDQAYLLSILSYDPASGALTWKPRPRDHFRSWHHYKTFHTACANQLATTIRASESERRKDKPRRCIHIDGHLYLAARIIWKMVYGAEPEYVDHIDRNSLNDALANLRSVTSVQNGRNRSKTRGSACPYKGVQKTQYGTYATDMTFDGQEIHLGTFKSAEAAATAFRSGIKLKGDEFMHSDYEGPDVLELVTWPLIFRYPAGLQPSEVEAFFASSIASGLQDVPAEHPLHSLAKIDWGWKRGA